MKQIKIIFKTKFQVSGNCPKDKQELKKPLLEATYEELCKKGTSVIFEPRLSLPTPSSATGTVHWKWTWALLPRTWPPCPRFPAPHQRVIFWGREGYQHFSPCPSSLWPCVVQLRTGVSSLPLCGTEALPWVQYSDNTGPQITAAPAYTVLHQKRQPREHSMLLVTFMIENSYFKKNILVE